MDRKMGRQQSFLFKNVYFFSYEYIIEEGSFEFDEMY